MSPECQAMIERAIDAMGAAGRRYRAALDDCHLRSLSAALDVLHGYQPGEGGWWLDRMMATAPLRMILSAIRIGWSFPVVMLHRQTTTHRRTEMGGMWIFEDRPEWQEKMVVAFEYHACELPRRMLLGEFQGLDRREPRPRVRRDPGPRLPGLEVEP